MCLVARLLVAVRSAIIWQRSKRGGNIMTSFVKTVATSMCSFRCSVSGSVGFIKTEPNRRLPHCYVHGHWCHSSLCEFRMLQPIEAHAATSASGRLLICRHVVAGNAHFGASLSAWLLHQRGMLRFGEFIHHRSLFLCLTHIAIALFQCRPCMFCGLFIEHRMV